MAKRELQWVVGPAIRSPADLKSCYLASVRLRAGVSSFAASRAGFSVAFGKVPSGSPNILVLGKCLDTFERERSDAWISGARALQAAGARVVLDFTDYPFDGASGAFYEHALAIADAVVCPSQPLSDLARQFSRGRIVVIEDAIEVDPRPPSGTRGDPLTALWFGSPTNLRYLTDLLAEMPPEYPLRMLVLTDKIAVEQLKTMAEGAPRHIQIEPSQWTINKMIAAAEKSDICLIPQDSSNPIKNGASSNRLITAMALGLPTAADMISSYTEFAAYFADIGSPEFFQFLNDPLQYTARVKAAQEVVCPRFYQPVIGRKWVEFFLSL